ncbi:MAG TPA: alpha/beta fold hydrolase [Verrucomicrobiae bacterium]|nr:alpha/beta fold hydrolase [Verrucomicrobiae bacterium]
MSEQQKSDPWVRPVKLLLLFGGSIYVVLCIAIAVSQRSLIYHPQVHTSEQVDQRALSAKLERWTNSIEQSIGFKRISSQPAEGVVLVLYGNASSATGSVHYADDIQKIANFDVFILEYPGYEDRAGEPTEKNLYAAATEALQLLPTNKPIYLLGESLGSGVASYLAGTYSNKISGIILISPYNRLTAVGQSYYPWLPVGLLMVDRFPSENYLRNYHGKIVITLDGKDVVVPEKFGRRLYDGYAGPKKLWEFPDGNHCQTMEPQFWREAVEFLRSK